MSSNVNALKVSSSSAGRAARVRNSWWKTTLAAWNWVSNPSRCSARVSAENSSRACSCVQPACSRPTALKVTTVRLSSNEDGMSGNHTDTSREGKSIPSGITPTTVRMTPLIVSFVPSTSGRAWKRDCQSRWLMSTTGGDSGAASSASSPRPTSGRTPKTAKKFGVTRSAGTDCAPSSPARCTSR